MVSDGTKVMIATIRIMEHDERYRKASDYFTSMHPNKHWDYATLKDEDGYNVWIAISKTSDVSFRYTLDGLGYIVKVEKEIK